MKNKKEIFSDIYNRKYKAVVSHCFGFTKNTHEAEDIAHDVFINFYNGMDKFRGEAKLDTWLFKITRNTCLNYIRSLNAKKRYASVTYSSNEIMDAAGIYGKQSFISFFEDKRKIDSLSYLIVREKYDWAMREIDKMKEPNRACMLKFIEHGDFDSYENVANSLSENVNSVRSRLGRCRTFLKNEIKKHVDYGELK
jgi:RNA polymerase sigma-70 factor (ECF subfamily)